MSFRFSASSGQCRSYFSSSSGQCRFSARFSSGHCRSSARTDAKWCKKVSCSLPPPLSPHFYSPRPSVHAHSITLRKENPKICSFIPAPLLIPSFPLLLVTIPPPGFNGSSTTTPNLFPLSYPWLFGRDSNKVVLCLLCSIGSSNFVKSGISIVLSQMSAHLTMFKHPQKAPLGPRC